MTDIHCHILPGIDDGARDISDTLQMARIAADCGITHIVATPHCNIPGEVRNYAGSGYYGALEYAREAILEAHIPVKLLSGMEVFVTFDLPDLIRQDKILTLNHSDYLLIEFDFGEESDFVDFMTDRILEMKITPVIAHPERYEFIKYDPDFALLLRKKGCLFQANKDSFLGKYGQGSEKTAFSLLRRGLINVVASDAHSPHHRTPDNKKALSTLSTDWDTKKLFSETPRKIITNEYVR